MGRRLPVLVLDDDIAEVLRRWVRRSTVSAGLAQRARIVLAAAQGATNVEVAESLGCTRPRWPSGADGSSPPASSGCPTSTGPGGPAPSATPRWKR